MAKERTLEDVQAEIRARTGDRRRVEPQTEDERLARRARNDKARNKAREKAREKKIAAEKAAKK